MSGLFYFCVSSAEGRVQAEAGAPVLSGRWDFSCSSVHVPLAAGANYQLLGSGEAQRIPGCRKSHLQEETVPSLPSVQTHCAGKI